MYLDRTFMMYRHQNKKRTTVNCIIIFLKRVLKIRRGKQKRSLKSMKDRYKFHHLVIKHILENGLIILEEIVLDILNGDTKRFVNKMRKLHHIIKLDISNWLSNGFMNFEVPKVGVIHIKSVINLCGLGTIQIK
ncbi:unnamed protein product [Paramecium pentaurelia]|uniref:Uncharacterized protein n=1 Tax=Paramecium pentaurelia TaxID=43138 RepID=A0A8S1U2B1_9CILI|nr:unnamed protein product [Paramecium pentaurelia]